MSTNLDKALILNRIKEFYNFKNDAEFAGFLGIARQTLSSWYSRKTFDIELLYAKCVDINPDFLFTGKGSVKKDDQTANSISVNDATREVVGVMPAVVTVDSSGRDNIVLVPTPAAAGYLNGYGDREFIEQLPAYSLPQMRNGTYRMFQVDGQSMYPTLGDKSFVVGEFVEDWAKQIKDDRIYVLVTLSDGVIVKRVLNRIDKYNNLYCKSDNRKNYPNLSVNPKDIIEVWEVKMHLSYNLPNPAEMYDRLNDLEADMEFLKEQLSRKLPN